MIDKTFNIAIDGPAGAGKSTIAKKVSAELGYIYVDTGAMYRAMGLYFLRNDIKSDDEASISAAVEKVDISLAYTDGIQHVYLNGEDVTGLIRTEAVGNMASNTSIYKQVREKLVELQIKIAKASNVVMDGRDIGTCVLPDADVKIFLTASIKTRAMRRFKELSEKGVNCGIIKIEADIAERDLRDITRKVSPLKRADDAIEIDSSDMSIDDVSFAIINKVKELKVQ